MCVFSTNIDPFSAGHGRPNFDVRLATPTAAAVSELPRFLSSFLIPFISFGLRLRFPFASSPPMSGSSSDPFDLTIESEHAGLSEDASLRYARLLQEQYVMESGQSLEDAYASYEKEAIDRGFPQLAQQSKKEAKRGRDNRNQPLKRSMRRKTQPGSSAAAAAAAPPSPEDTESEGEGSEDGWKDEPVIGDDKLLMTPEVFAATFEGITDDDTTVQPEEEEEELGELYENCVVDPDEYIHEEDAPSPPPHPSSASPTTAPAPVFTSPNNKIPLPHPALRTFRPRTKGRGNAWITSTGLREVRRSASDAGKEEKERLESGRSTGGPSSVSKALGAQPGQLLFIVIEIFHYLWKHSMIKGRCVPHIWGRSLMKGDKNWPEPAPWRFQDFLYQMMGPHTADHKRLVIVVPESMTKWHSANPYQRKRQFAELFDSFSNEMRDRPDVSVIRQTTNNGGVVKTCHELRKLGYAAEAADCDQGAGLLGDVNTHPLTQWTQFGRNPGEGNHERNKWKRYYSRVKKTWSFKSPKEALQFYDVFCSFSNRYRLPGLPMSVKTFLGMVWDQYSKDDPQHDLPSIDKVMSWLIVPPGVDRAELTQDLKRLWLYIRCQGVYPVCVHPDTGKVVSDTSRKVPLSDFPPGYSEADLLEIPPRDKYRHLRAPQDPHRAPRTRISLLRTAIRKTAKQRYEEYQKREIGHVEKAIEETKNESVNVDSITLSRGVARSNSHGQTGGWFSRHSTCQRHFGNHLHGGEKGALLAALECRLRHLQGHGCPKCNDGGSGWEEFQKRETQRLKVERIDSFIQVVEAAIRDGRQETPPHGIGVSHVPPSTWRMSHKEHGRPRCEIPFTAGTVSYPTSMEALLRKRQHAVEGGCDECAPSARMHDNEEAGPQLTKRNRRMMTSIDAALEVIDNGDVPTSLKNTGVMVGRLGTQ
ncbi:unnamed protein product [Vitrella brassicaformis CCMP3155]|uniref:Uncharacterized protein n=3 Tax=Vitrella brassicaformis TaxID=1169539 RepID=A0A0G4FG10_VITBC|nr:unnamed protein product [Vitrella brassicaformis CCMP3155]|eukprot:CEM12180.1 unnamed protein product [Vitrella brassicaformis CCMP3155]